MLINWKKLEKKRESAPKKCFKIRIFRPEGVILGTPYIKKRDV